MLPGVHLLMCLVCKRRQHRAGREGRAASCAAGPVQHAPAIGQPLRLCSRHLKQAGAKEALQRGVPPAN